MVVIEIIGGTLLLMSALAFLLLAVLDLATVDAVSATAATTSNAVATLRQVAAGAITPDPGTTIRPVRHPPIKSKCPGDRRLARRLRTAA